MERDAYDRMAALQDRHWWFVARRRLVAAVLARLNLPAKARILEAGCGTGGNLSMLAAFGEVSAFEPDVGALAVAVQQGPYKVLQGSLPDAVPFAWRGFDLVVALDVLEHINDDQGALVNLKKYLAPGGRLLLTVPAYRWLWSAHDARHHHHRRYTRRELRDQLGQAGYRVARIGYFNTLLFPLIVVARLVQNLRGQAGMPDDTMPRPWLNRLLSAVFSAEALWMGRGGMPFGVSLLAVAALPEND